MYPDFYSFSRSSARRNPLYWVVVLLLLCGGSTASAQLTDLFRPADAPDLERRVATRDADLTDFSVLSIDEAAAGELLTGQPATLEVELPDPRGGGILALELERFQLLGENFTITEMPSGRVVNDIPAGVFYRGSVRGLPGAVAVLSIVDGQASGLVSLPGESGELNLVRLEDEDAYLFYDDAEIKHKFDDLDCEVLQPKGGGQDDGEVDGVPRKVDGCFGIFLDISEDIYRERGGTAGAVAYLEGAFAQVATLYANEQIDITISGTQVWTSREPFYDDLGLYRSYRASNNVDGTVAHYVHRAGGGGVAYLNVLCNKSYGYGLSGINNSYAEVPNYSWTVMVLAHELGHNFGSEHTHDCAWNGNNTPIDGCGSSNNGCGVSSYIPEDGGTIMSYCHLTSAGINFTKGFGTQPGDRIRYRASLASCNGYDCGTDSGGGTGGGGGGGPVAGAVPDGRYTLYARHSGKTVAVANGSLSNGANVQQETDRGLESQQWDVTHLGQEVYRLTNVTSELALDVEGSNSSNRANVNQWTYVGQANQQWQLENLGGGYFHLRATHSDRCLSVERGSTSDGANLLQWNCSGKTNDDFRFVPVGAAALATFQDVPELLVYPNPARGSVTLEMYLPDDLGVGEATLYDVRGRQVAVQSFAAVRGQVKVVMDIADRAPGVYVLRVGTGGETFTRRLVIAD